MRLSKIITLFILMLVPVVLTAQLPDRTQQLRRSALVIGNGNYISSTLANPENDARAIATNLKNLGFVVYKYEDLTQSQMKKAIDDYGISLKGYDVGLFFYAGHGIQASGYNYLIPVDARLTTERQVEYDCVQADRILALMEGSGTKVNIIILDACRNNPFERAWTRSSTGRGLAFMNAPGGTLIAYSTAPGTTAQDGSGNNSPYTEAFIESLKIQGQSISQLFQNVTRIVSQKTGKQQVPWISSSLTGDFFLNTSAAPKTGSQNQTANQNMTVENLSLPITEERRESEITADFFIDPVENRRYKTERIGNQIWMTENLSTTKFNDGTSIRLVTDDNAWTNLSTPAYCWYNNDATTNKVTFGALYNWYAVNSGKLCPKGWHIPTDDEWSILAEYLGGSDVAGGKLKETGTTHWKSPNTGATNETGFTALPGGYRFFAGESDAIGGTGFWWSSTEQNSIIAWSRLMYALEGVIGRDRYYKKYGMSVRCVRD
jgi:uncharacterized protein (TIGR02145 family)